MYDFFVNAVRCKPLSWLETQVFVKGLLEEEMQGRRFLLRTAADFVAVRGAVNPRPLLQRREFDAHTAAAPPPANGAAMGRGGGLTVVG